MLQKILTSLTDQEEAILLTYLEKRKAQTGFLLTELGDISQELYIIISGKYEVYQKVRIGGSDLAVNVASLEGPMIIGESNLFIQKKRNATILISEDGEYWALTQEKFEELKKSYPNIAILLLESCARIVTQRFNDTQKNMRKKLIEDVSTVTVALENLKQFYNKAYLCPKHLAQKLFAHDPSWEGVSEKLMEELLEKELKIQKRFEEKRKK